MLSIILFFGIIFNHTTFDVVNDIRADAGLNRLQKDDRLKPFCEARLDDMLEYDYFTHDNPTTGGHWSTALMDSDLEYNYFGENLARGYGENGGKIATAWYDSPKHKDNLLDKEYTHTVICSRQDITVQLYASI